MGNIISFLDEDYTNYAVYRVFQRLPHIIDSLGQTQRKILYTLESFPEAKKHKTAEVYSHVYTKTLYMHGDASVYTVVENLARECSNNINLLTEEGSFGYRTDKSAASPRYTGTRFSKLARLIFRRDDWPIFEQQVFEGKTIEPKYLLPILPVGLLNGYSGIAVGFASKILPRDPVDLINKIQDALKYKKRKNAKWDTYQIPEVNLAFPFFGGNGSSNTINKITDPLKVKNSSWLIKGSLSKGRRNTIHITDLPPDMSRESYIKKLKKLIDKEVIKDFSESCVKHKLLFDIKVTPEIFKKSEDELIDLLGMFDKVSENFTFLNPGGEGKNTIIKFNTAEEYLKVFIEERQKFYQIRKKYQLDLLQHEILILKERIRFIKEVNAGDIIITKRKKVDLEKELLSKDYIARENGLDHLLGMKMYALTEENIARFEVLISSKEKEYQTLDKTSTEDIHIRELHELLRAGDAEFKKKGFL